MKHKKWEELADKLMEMSTPMLEKITDDTDDIVPAKMLEACSGMVELAHYLYEVAMMKKKMYPHDYDEHENPKPHMNPKPYANPSPSAEQ